MTGARTPTYRLPRRELAGLAFDLLLGRRRSFARDSRTVLEANPYPRRVEGGEQVPAAGNFVVVMNHYSRPGLRPYHCAMAVSDALARRRPELADVRWAITSEWLGQRVGPVPIPLSLVRWVFGRVALVYGFVVLPRRVELVAARAAALRALGRGLATAPVGLAPEGLRAASTLVEPPEGAGLFLAMLTHRGEPLLPVAVWPDELTLVVRIGAPFRISVPSHAARDEQDRLAREQVMVAIGRLLPREYWGAYEDAIAVVHGE